MARHLHHHQRQRDRAAGQAPGQERHQLGDIGGEVVLDEATDVVVDRAPLFDRRGDRREVVVEQDDVRGLAGDVGATAPHRDAESAARSAGASLTPSPVMATTSPALRAAHGGDCAACSPD